MCLCVLLKFNNFLNFFIKDSGVSDEECSKVPLKRGRKRTLSSKSIQSSKKKNEKVVEETQKGSSLKIFSYQKYIFKKPYSLLEHSVLDFHSVPSNLFGVKESEKL